MADRKTQLTYGVHQNWANGQASSLQFGLRLADSLAASPFHALVAVCDQPLLTASHYRALIDAVREQNCLVAATSYHEGGGVPACFHDTARAKLLEVSGDVGAKGWIRQQTPNQVVRFDFGPATRAVDTVQAWHKLCVDDCFHSEIPSTPSD